MTKTEQQAHAFIAQAPDPRELVAISESLRLGRARCVEADADGVLARVEASGDYLLAARDAEAATRLFAEVSWDEHADCTVALVDASWADALPWSRGPLPAPEEASEVPPLRYRLCVCERDEPVPVRGALHIEPLGMDDLSVVCAHYKNLSEESIRRHLAEGWMHGGYDASGELVGFIGEHDEAAIGMLVVFPEHRRCGYAFELAGAAINRMLDAGRVPFSQVVLGNEASFALHRKLGMTALPGIQCWVW